MQDTASRYKFLKSTAKTYQNCLGWDFVPLILAQRFTVRFGHIFLASSRDCLPETKRGDEELALRRYGNDNGNGDENLVGDDNCGVGWEDAVINSSGLPPWMSLNLTMNSLPLLHFSLRPCGRCSSSQEPSSSYKGRANNLAMMDGHQYLRL